MIRNRHPRVRLWFLLGLIHRGVECSHDGHHQQHQQHVVMDPSWHEDSPHELVQDDDGSLCVDGACYDGSAQDHLSDVQLELLEKQQEACQDQIEHCPELVANTHQGGCANRTLRPYSCGICSPIRIQRTSTSLSPTTTTQRRQRRRAPIYNAWGSDLGVPQVFRDAPEHELHRILEDTRLYMQHEVLVDDVYQAVRDKCVNKHPSCVTWAAQGKCDDADEDHPIWELCAPVCQYCHELHYTARCPIDQNMKHALYPGELNQLFERIVQDPYYVESLGLSVLSRPSYADGDDEDNVSYILGPWVLQFDQFSTPEEAKVLIEAGAVVGYERSEDVGEELDDGQVTGEVSMGRTSTNAWCDAEHCEIHPEVQAVLARIENVTGISRNYSESLQLLRYEVGQFYEEHHDYIEIDRMRIQGVRVLTLYLYLNNVEEGGGTNFPFLDLTVMPKLGRAIMWPSVLDEDPHYKDPRTNHQALPVLKGIKYGANAWLHQRMFRVAYERGC